MCYPISGYVMMVNGTPKVWVSETTDSHMEIAREFNLRDDKMRSGKFYAFEFHPGEKPSPDLDTWDLDWDSDATSGCREKPSKDNEIEFRPAIERRCKKYVVTRGNHTLDEGRLFAFGVSAVTQSGGKCWTYNNNTVVKSGGMCFANGNSTVSQSGGECQVLGDATVIQTDGECWTNGNAIATLSGGVCRGYDNSTVNQSGGECTLTKYFTGAYNKVGNGPMTLIDRRE